MLEPVDYEGLDRDTILRLCEQEGVRFLRLQFQDILGAEKNVELPAGQIGKALDGAVTFDGSSIEGFVRLEESDMLLAPDLATFRIYPWDEPQGRVARLICDVTDPDGSPIPGSPRSVLKRAVDKAAAAGQAVRLAPEVEFFLFHRGPDGAPTTDTHDTAAYFDLTPADRGEEARRRVVTMLEAMGFGVEAAHHEVAPGQHEIDLPFDDPVASADKVATLKLVVRKVATDYGLHATFMPKPVAGANGSGMHTYLAAFQAGKNALDGRELGLSPLGRYWIGGLLAHARGMCAVTNPLVNSYKRLVAGHEAPTHVVWSEKNRSPLVRMPARRGEDTALELRMPDPSCNPYLAFAVMIVAGLDGVSRRLEPGAAVNKDVLPMSQREKRRLRIDDLPADLGEALRAMKKDPLIREALGDAVYHDFLAAKTAAWQDYSNTVHDWEVERYLTRY